MKPLTLLPCIACAVLLGACSSSHSVATPATLATSAATPKAVCGPGSRPETGIQGRVSAADQASGLATQGITCNTELVGSYTVPDAKGTVGGFKVERYTDAAGHDCAYYDTTFLFPTNILDQTAGVNVLDMSDPTKPTLTASLTTPAMLSPHESLVVSQQRGVLAAVLGNPAFGPGVVDVYDISADCRHPVLKSTAPVGVLGHESGMAPDGKTFYSASPGTPTIVAIDISNPALPVPLAILPYASHGLSISADGNRAYLAGVGSPSGAACAYALSCDVPDPNHDRGLIILDVSEIQARKTAPQAHEIARLQWPTMSIPQNAIPFTQKGHPYLLEIDEFARGGTTGSGLPGPSGLVGAGRIIDIGDETHPKVISDLRLEVHNPENYAAIANDPGAQFVGQGYAGHYCNVPTRVDPTIAACSMILSGLRVFDIRDPAHPKEIAYYNAPQYPRVTPYLVQSGYAMSSPSFVPERHEIWYSDVYSGFYAVRLTNGAWPSN
ncbi:MAG: hypothetical protein E6R07_14735 [Nevskiaceae bacterium]|nr:MAG: hypothetical protein E6R07_14735 [Nevskiaceae bacterium]